MRFQRTLFIEKKRNIKLRKRLFHRRRIGFNIGNKHREIAVAQRTIPRHARPDRHGDFFRLVVFIFRFEKTNRARGIFFSSAGKRRWIEQPFAQYFRLFFQRHALIFRPYCSARFFVWFIARFIFQFTVFARIFFGGFQKRRKGAARIEIFVAEAEYSRDVPGSAKRRFQRFRRLGSKRTVTKKINVGGLTSA